MARTARTIRTAWTASTTTADHGQQRRGSSHKTAPPEVFASRTGGRDSGRVTCLTLSLAFATIELSQVSHTLPFLLLPLREWRQVAQARNDNGNDHGGGGGDGGDYDNGGGHRGYGNRRRYIYVLYVIWYLFQV